MASIPQCKLAGGGQLVQINAAGVQGPDRAALGRPATSGPDGTDRATAAATWTKYSIPLGGLQDVFIPNNNEFARLQCLESPYPPSIRVGFLGHYSPRPGPVA